jgi:hypothetical protein
LEVDPDAELAFSNIHRMMEMYALDRHILSIRLMTADRFFFEASGTMPPALTHLEARGLFAETLPSGGPHNLVYQLWSGKWGKRRSFRAHDRPSLQVTLTEFHDNRRRWVGDADLDLGNPVMDVVGFFTHLVELIVPGKTSHRKLEKQIAKRYESWKTRQKENA